MMRCVLAAAVSVAFFLGSAAAADLKAKVISFDADKKLLVVSVDGKEQQVHLTDDTDCQCVATGKQVKFSVGKQICTTFVKKGVPVNVTTSTKDGKEVASKIQFNLDRK